MKRRVLIIAGFMTVVLLACSLFGIKTVKAADYGTNFKFKDLKAMQDDGWSISNSAGVSLVSNGVVLDGSKGVSAIGYGDVPANVTDWKVGAIGIWLGGNGHSWIDVQVNTKLHTYVFALDGSSSQYVLLRDNVKVIGVGGYQEAANSSFEIHLEKLGSTITMSCNSQVIKTYTETDSSPVTGVGITSPPSSAALYTFAGASVPEPSSSGPVGTTTEPIPTTTETPTSTPAETNPSPITTAPPAANQNYNSSWANYDPGDLTGLTAGADSGIQDNPGTEFDFTNQEPDGNIPKPPTPPTAPTPQNSYDPIVIVMLPGTFSINTDKPQKDYLCYALAGNRIFDGAGQMQNVYLGEGDPEVLKKIRWEQRVLELTNDYSNGEINMYGGNIPNYYVSGNTHISGDLYHPDTNQSAVAVLTFQVTDKDGNIVYQNKITGVASEGKSLADYWEKAAQDINTYLQNAINRPKKTN